MEQNNADQSFQNVTIKEEKDDAVIFVENKESAVIGQQSQQCDDSLDVTIKQEKDEAVIFVGNGGTQSNVNTLNDPSDDEVTIIYDLKLPYKCHFCSKKFKTEGSLRNHLNIHNLPNSIECRKCKILFKSGKLLKKHVRRTHPEEWENTCRVCGRDFKNGSELEIHFKDHNYKCSMCGKVFLTKSARKKHNQVHIEQRCYKCNLCGQEFLYERFLLAHLTVHNVTV